MKIELMPVDDRYKNGTGDMQNGSRGGERCLLPMLPSLLHNPEVEPEQSTDNDQS